MALHKKNIIRLILLTLLLFTLFSSFQISNVQAQSSKNYTFNSTEIYNQNNPSFNSTFNVRNQTTFGGLYNATFSFTDDDDNTTPDDFICDEGGGTTRVISEYDSHDKVLRMYDDANDDTVGAEQIGNIQVSGTHEFWFQTDDADQRSYVSGKGITNYRYQIYCYQGTWWYHDGTLHDTSVDCLDDTWYHIRIDFEHDDGSYLGLAPDTYNFKLDGVLIGTYDIIDSGEWLDRIVLGTSTPDNNFNGYYDAIGFSNHKFYSVGENVFPNVSATNTQEVDKFEFAYDLDGTPTDPSQTDIPFWSTTSGTPYISPNAGLDDATVCFISASTTHWTLEREIAQNFGVVDVFFRMTFYAYFGSGETHTYDFNIYSYDTTLIARIRLSGISDLDLTYYDGSDYQMLYDDVNDLFPQVLTLNITMINSSIYLRSNLFSSLYIDKIDTSKEGIGKIEVDTYATGIEPGSNLYIDSIACYVEGISQSLDFATYGISGISWNLEQSTFIYINASGSFALSFTNEVPYDFGLSEYREYYGVNRLFLEYITTYNSTNGIIKVITNTSFILSTLNIYQVYLTSASVNYYIDFELGGTTVNESYFYVDSSHRLRFSLTVNNNNSEFIQASFNIPNVLSENRSISFMSNIDGTSLGFFRMMYTDDTSSFILFPTWQSTSNVILPQTKDIDNLAILITDNDNNDNDYCYGYVSNVQLIYLTDSLTTITTLNLMMVIVPIIVMLVPTFGIASKYGKSVILPIFILMSIICFISELIPVWLFFVIMFGAGAFLFMKYKVGIE